MFRHPLMTDSTEVGELISPLPQRHEGDEGCRDRDTNHDPYKGHERVQSSVAVER